MSSNNGKTKGIIGRRDETNSQAVADGEEVSRAKSAISGVQRHLEADQGVSIWGNRRERSESASTDTGKILKRLENLEKRFFSYIRSHQERLDLRKKESEIVEEEFAKEVADLKQDILDFMQKAEEVE